MSEGGVHSAVRARSGATAVQIAEYLDGRQQIVVHVGSAHTDAEPGVLIEQAEKQLSDPAQGVPGLEVEATARVRQVLSAAVSRRTLLGATSSPVGSDGPGRVTGTDSRLLSDVLAGVCGDLGFGVLGDRVFCDLVVARIVEPTSLLDTGRALSDLGRRPVAYKTLQRTLAKAASANYGEQIGAACYRMRHAMAISPWCFTT